MGSHKKDTLAHGVLLVRGALGFPGLNGVRQDTKCISYLVHSISIVLEKPVCKKNSKCDYLHTSQQRNLKSYQVLRIVNFIDPDRTVIKYYFFFNKLRRPENCVFK